MATGATTNYFLPYPLSTDPVRVAGDIEQLATKIDTILNEEIEDAAASMWTGGTFSNGLNTPTYNDSTGKMSMSLAQDIQTTATPTFTGVNLVGGDLYLGPSRSIIFEGSSDDAFETIFTVTNPTADRTITFQNATGTVAFTSESTMASLVNIANTTGAITVQVGYGATTNGTTKTINIGPNGVSGSTTNINIGSAVSGALGTLTINSSSVSIPSNSISVGTITSGVWQGTPITADEGGTGQSSYTVGDILYASASNALSKLAGVATGNALISGGVGAAPTWGKIGLTTHVSGTLPVANGGTGITSFGSGIATWLGTPSSANLAAAVTDETGSGALVFANSPTFTGTITAATINASTFNSTGSDITLLSSVTGSPSSNASIVVNRGTSSDVAIRWNESSQTWEFTNDGTTYTAIGAGGGGGSANVTDILLFAGM